MGVSIVIPCRQLDDYLPAALMSVEDAMQGLKAEMVIVIPKNDNNLNNYLTNYISSRPKTDITVIETDVNGIVPALNLGISKTKYELIARMDADDLMDITRLHLQSNFLNANPDVVLLGSAVTVVDKNGETLRNVIFPLSDAEIRKKIVFVNAFSHPSVMFRKSAFNLTGGYSKNFTAAEDFELWTRFLKIGKAANLALPLLKYREHRNQASILDSSLISEARLVIAFRSQLTRKFSTHKPGFVDFNDDISVVAAKINLIGILNLVIRKVTFSEYLISRKARSTVYISRALTATINGGRNWGRTIGNLVMSGILSPTQLFKFIIVLSPRVFHFKKNT